jgi:hypothetical protein
MNAPDVIRAMFIEVAVAVPVAVLLALLWVSILRALDRRRRGQR